MDMETNPPVEPPAIDQPDNAEPEHKCRELPPNIHQRGNMLWVSVKDATGRWRNSTTGCTVDHLDKAIQFLRAKQRAVQSLIRVEKKINVLTIKKYADPWADERKKRGLATAASDKSRLEKYVYPYIGEIAMEELRPHHVRDLIRKLRSLKRDDGSPMLAPRSVLHVYHILHNIFESAIVDEHVIANPVKVHRGELPKKVDLDPEWREQATYQAPEVTKLLGSNLIPPERRVMYALKSLAGLRHGEAAALCWRHIDEVYEPLAKMNVAQSFQSSTGEVKRTKDETTRTVPVHPLLMRILKAWREDHWVRVYGRKPTKDDFIVPTRTFRCVTCKDANEAFKRDLAACELRVEAGSLRDRGGHDLRGWYQTQAIEDGADSLLVRRTTHAAPKDVEGGYERFSWKSKCAAVAKLIIVLPDGDALPFIMTPSREARLAKRYGSKVASLGLEPNSNHLEQRNMFDHPTEKPFPKRDRRNTLLVRTETIAVTTTAAQLIEKAARAGDIPRILEIARQLREVIPLPPKNGRRATRPK